MFPNTDSLNTQYLSIISIVSQYGELRQFCVFHSSDRRLLPIHHHVGDRVTICSRVGSR